MSARMLPLSSSEDKDSRDKDSHMSFETSVASSQEYIMKDSSLGMTTYI